MRVAAFEVFSMLNFELSTTFCWLKRMIDIWINGFIACTTLFLENSTTLVRGNNVKLTGTGTARTMTWYYSSNILLYLTNFACLDGLFWRFLRDSYQTYRHAMRNGVQLDSIRGGFHQSSRQRWIEVQKYGQLCFTSNV